MFWTVEITAGIPHAAAVRAVLLVLLQQSGSNGGFWIIGKTRNGKLELAARFLRKLVRKRKLKSLT